jgi:hypothetical protein
MVLMLMTVSQGHEDFARSDIKRGTLAPCQVELLNGLNLPILDLLFNLIMRYRYQMLCCQIENKYLKIFSTP